MAATNVLGGSLASPALAHEPRRRGEGTSAAARLLWLTGDHHIHTQYSPEAQYRTSQQVQRGAQYGLDWMVITDHGSVAHAKDDVARVNADIVQARVDNARTLGFQGLEWNIFSAEHGTVFVAPGPGEVPLLREHVRRAGPRHTELRHRERGPRPVGTGLPARRGQQQPDRRCLDAGLRGVAVDTAGPRVEALGNADSWQDLWPSTNPIFVLPRR